MPSVYLCHHSNKTLKTLHSALQYKHSAEIVVMCYHHVYCFGTWLNVLLESELYLEKLFSQTFSCLKTWIEFNSNQVLRNRNIEEK